MFAAFITSCQPVFGTEANASVTYALHRRVEGLEIPRASDRNCSQLCYGTSLSIVVV